MCGLLREVNSQPKSVSSNKTMDNSHLEALGELIQTVAKLRSPQGGCPWDLAQTPETLIPYILEEAYEVADAIRRGDPTEIADELGDLLLQVVLQSQIFNEAAEFSIATVAQKINQKLIRRHPHVFGDQQIDKGNLDEIRQNWEQIKAAETGQDPNRLSNRLSRYARTLPPMTAAMKISTAAAEAGFEWEDINGVWAKFHEELSEFEEALQTEDYAHQQAELGDLLFCVIQLARWYKLDVVAALAGTNQRFVSRFTQLEQMRDRPLSEYTIAELEALWQKAKQQTG